MECCICKIDYYEHVLNKRYFFKEVLHTTKCNHVMCVFCCLQYICEASNKCPLCRSAITFNKSIIELTIERNINHLYHMFLNDISIRNDFYKTF